MGCMACWPWVRLTYENQWLTSFLVIFPNKIVKTRTNNNYRTHNTGNFTISINKIRNIVRTQKKAKPFITPLQFRRKSEYEWILRYMWYFKMPRNFMLRDQLKKNRKIEIFFLYIFRIPKIWRTEMPTFNDILSSEFLYLNNSSHSHGDTKS